MTNNNQTRRNATEIQSFTCGSACVNLDRVERSHAGLKVTVASETRAFCWTVTCSARHLQTFARFQRLMADKHGVWISHKSQDFDGRNAASQREVNWQLAVAKAFDAGAK